MGPQQVSSAAKYDEEIRAALAKGARPKAIWDQLRLKHKDDFKVRLRAVQRYCRQLKRERGVQAEDVAIPVVTGPGEVAQVDFGYLGRVYDPDTGKLLRLIREIMKNLAPQRPHKCLCFSSAVSFCAWRASAPTPWSPEGGSLASPTILGG
jgi:hypothetical protein